MAKAKEPMTALDRLLKARLDGSNASLPDDEAARAQLPLVWDFLTRRDADEKHTMTPGSVSIRMGLGEWLVTISSPALEVTLDAVAPSLLTALQAIEAAMGRSDAAWKPYKDSRGKFSKKGGGTA